MALTTYTITGKVAVPGDTSSLEGRSGKITLWPTTVDMVIRDASAHVAFVGKQTWDVAADGSVDITLIATNAAGAQPAGEYFWTGQYVSADRSVLLRIPAFELESNTTFDSLLDVSGVPITSSLVSQAEAARDEAVAAKADAEDARDAALAVGSTNDTIISGRVADTASATRGALDAMILINRTATMNLRKEITPSGSNDTAAVNTKLAAFAAAGGGKVIWPRDGWKFTGATSVGVTGTGAPLHFELEDDLDLDMTGMTATIGFLVGGSATATTAALGADALKGAETITCALTCTAGDIIRIKSTDLFETLSNQPKGEMAEVLSVAGGVITLKGGLYDSYTAATTTVTLLQMPRVTFEGEARLRRNTNNQGLQVAFARDVSLAGLYAEGARERLFYLQHCYGATVDNVKGRDFWFSGTGTSYGLVVAASQHVKEIGLDLRGGRHAVSHGGLLPCRDVQTIGGTFDNYHASGQKSFDYHGDCEHVRIVGATILNGLNSQASNSTVTGGARIRSVAAVPAVEIGPARSCDYVKIDASVDIESASGQDGVAYISRNGSNATTLGMLEIGATIRSGAACVDLFPSASGNTGATIDRAYLRGDWYTSSISAPLTSTMSGSAEIVINHLECDARRWRSDGGNTVTLIGSAPKKGDVLYRGKFSTGKSAGAPISDDKFQDVTLDNATLEGTNAPLRSTFTGAGRFHARNVTINGGSSAGGLNAPSFDEGLVANLVRLNTTGTPNLPTRTYESMDAYGNVVASATAVPTKGVWAVSDFVKNRGVAAAGSPGWDVTTAGGASSATWAATTAYALNAWVKTSTGKVLQCTTAGTSSGSEPAPTTVGDVVTDGGVTWVYRSATSAVFKARANDAA